MELLDAAIALVVTIAALATTVTVGMEICIRVFGLKRAGQVQLFAAIWDQALAGRLPTTADRWQFMYTVLQNPLAPTAFREPGNHWFPYAGTRGTSIYEWVSHEHVFRRLLELPGVLEQSEADLVHLLQRFNTRFDEYCSAASARFTQDRRFWSLVGGVVLAFALNADVLRIYDHFLQRPELAGAVAARLEQLEAVHIAARQRTAEAGGGADAAAGVRRDIAALQATVEDLAGEGVPIGWRYWPHCLAVQASGPSEALCRGDGPIPNAPVEWLGAVMRLLLSGLLIGLGAPFWFDAARRLSEVRSLFGGKSTGTQVHSGKAPGPAAQPAQTQELIGRVVREALEERDALQRAATPPSPAPG